MTINAWLARVYTQGLAAHDFRKLRRDEILIRPVQPPKQVGTIVVPDSVASVGGREAVVYEVLRMPEERSPDFNEIWTSATFGPGALVVVRNTHIDLIDTSRQIALCHARHVLGELKPIEDEPEPELAIVVGEITDEHEEANHGDEHTPAS